MKTNIKVAIYLNHYRADVFEYSERAELIQTIESEFNAVEKKKMLLKGESHMHHKEQDLQLKFYDTLKKVLVKYDAILLFGNTSAKTELLHVLQADNSFANKEIILKNTDRLTENQKKAVVNDLFTSL